MFLSLINSSPKGICLPGLDQVSIKGLQGVEYCEWPRVLEKQGAGVRLSCESLTRNRKSILGSFRHRFSCWRFPSAKKNYVSFVQQLLSCFLALEEQRPYCETPGDSTWNLSGPPSHEVRAPGTVTRGWKQRLWDRVGQGGVSEPCQQIGYTSLWGLGKSWEWTAAARQPHSGAAHSRWQGKSLSTSEYWSSTAVHAEGLVGGVNNWPDERGLGGNILKCGEPRNLGRSYMKEDAGVWLCFKHANKHQRAPRTEALNHQVHRDSAQRASWRQPLLAQADLASAASEGSTGQHRRPARSPEWGMVSLRHRLATPWQVDHIRSPISIKHQPFICAGAPISHTGLSFLFTDLSQHQRAAEHGPPSRGSQRGPRRMGPSSPPHPILQKQLVSQNTAVAYEGQWQFQLQGRGYNFE